MNVLIAPDKFKHALAGSAVAMAMRDGVRAARPEATITLQPVADGGEGTARLLADFEHATEMPTRALDPLARPIDASWYRTPGGAALIELAAASGIEHLAPDERDALRATSFGTGQLIRAALDAGCRNITLGVGGSACVDGGAGCLQALGWRLLDCRGHVLREPLGGGDLERVRGLRPPDVLPSADLEILCDVDNPLLGRHGAARVFAPQKGASPEHVQLLERALAHWASILAVYTGRDRSRFPGAGAAGGLPAGLAGAANALLRPGFDEVARRIGLSGKIADADVILTGEGRLDAQTLGGKSVAGVTRLARRIGRPVVVFAGSVDSPGGTDPTAEAERFGVSAVVRVTPDGLPLETALPRTADLLRRAVERYFREARIGMTR